MKTNQLHIETSTRMLEELERAAYMAGDIGQAELYGNMLDTPVGEQITELKADLADANDEIEDLRQEIDELKRVIYQFANLDPKNHIEILRAIQRAGALI